MKSSYCHLIVLVLISMTAKAHGQEIMDQKVFETLPVREATVFKDGHAFVLHEGSMPTDGEGNVVLDRLPRPVMGTFWSFAKNGATMKAVVAGRRRVNIERTALGLPDFLRANVGKRVIITDKDKATFEATIVGFPVRSSAELAETNPADADPALPAQGEIVLLKTEQGTKALAIDRILDAIFIDNFATKLSSEEFRETLTLQLQGTTSNARADVELVYLQRGLRWIPNYRIELLPEGKAQLELRAVLINELVDLNDVKLHLAVGAPNFKFQDDVDPISLRQTVAQISAALGGGVTYGRRSSDFSNNFSNAIMSQHAMPMAGGQMEPATMDLGPAVEAPGRSEDLYLFTLEHITLKKGERMSLSLATTTLDYEDVYILDIPFAAPSELVRNLNSDQQREMVRLMARPKAMHKARITNRGPHPLTTAPALVLKNGQALGQGMMTYTPVGATVDVEITTAVGVQVAKDESETERTPNALRVGGSDFARIGMKGALRIKNYQEKPAKLIVTRYVLGRFDTATPEGTLTNGSIFDDELMLAGAGAASWWSQYAWPWWWGSVNGIGRAQWTMTLEPGKETELGYAWHYFWS